MDNNPLCIKKWNKIEVSKVFIFIFAWTKGKQSTFLHNQSFFIMLWWKNNEHLRNLRLSWHLLITASVYLFIYLSNTVFAQQHHADIEGMSALSSLWLNAKKWLSNYKKYWKLGSGFWWHERRVLRSPLLPRSSSSFDICFRIFNLNSFITEKSRNDT